MRWTPESQSPELTRIVSLPDAAVARNRSMQSPVRSSEAFKVFPSTRKAVTRQLPVSALLVGFTTLRRWILALPISAGQVVDTAAAVLTESKAKASALPPKPLSDSCPSVVID
jgi:hypothetical protein